MRGKICACCGLMSEGLKTEEDFIKAGWMWGNLNFKNGAEISFSLCPECKTKDGSIPYLKEGWAHRASEKAERTGGIGNLRG